MAIAFSDQQSTGLVLYHAATISTTTRVSQLLVGGCGTVAIVLDDETLSTDYLSETENISVRMLTDSSAL